MGIYRRLSAFFMPLFSFFSSIRSCGLERVVSSETETVESRDRGRDETETRPRPIKSGLETSITVTYYLML